MPENAISRPYLNSLLVITLTIGLLLGLAETVRAGDRSTSLSYLPSISSYLQVRYTDPDPGDDRLSLRRFKAMLDGGPKDRLHYHLQFIYKANNNSATDNRIFMQDAYITYPIGLSLKVKVGQFIPPFGLERFQPDRTLDFVDRTDVTTRLAVNGNLGDSFARDRGIQCDWNDHMGVQLSAGVFQGAGANNPGRGNGPLGVARLSYIHEGSGQVRKWSWRAGLAGSARCDADQNFSGQLPGLSKSLTSRFEGRDMRLNAFAQVGWGPLRAQGEYFRVWFEPTSGSEIAATGTYGQVVYLPIERVTVGLRYEGFTPDVHERTAPSLSQWTTAVTCDLPWPSLRFSTDYSWRTDGGTAPSSVWRVQVQYFIFP